MPEADVENHYDKIVRSLGKIGIQEYALLPREMNLRP